MARPQCDTPVVPKKKKKNLALKKNCFPAYAYFVKVELIKWPSPIPRN